MAKKIEKISTERANLASILVSTLDEGLFFTELSKHLSSIVNCDASLVYLVKQDHSARLIAENGEAASEERILEKGQGVAGHVIRTKKSYFSNNISRDPLFANDQKEGIQSELCLPIAVDGVVIATAHFLRKTEDEIFSRDDITTLLQSLEELSLPLRNIKMYLSAKLLNETLLQKVNEKEKELEKRKLGIQVASSIKIEEKKIVGKSEAMKGLLDVSEKVAATNASVLVEGETGTGKELIARRVHCRGSRVEHNFISIDCSPLDEMSLEKEIFGREAEVFNGIAQMGALERAHNGTLFINNIDRLPATLQSKLMNFITEKRAIKVGGQTPYSCDVRIISASSRDVSKLVESGEFREDLFYSLSTMTLRIPSLKERRDDIEILAHYFLNEGKTADDQKSLAPGALVALKEYRWPGNVRELRSAMERAAILSDGAIIEKAHLSENILSDKVEIQEEEATQEVYTEMTLDELEKKHICLTLEHLGGNKTKTAKTLGITVKTLYNKLHSYGMIETKEA